ncbi:protein kinase domain-containing protein [Chamaesiphon sp. VAR_48_metabat_403]|uniref:protein kinase domain-containing protein n=1 Tax=Chamaesiphon sp. VAR_48_metabat_403 TaxID=2964700 RepID=UPI00286E1BE2|nr:PsbP-related protein [Chamaesiphon sp. VAR_48_metabat_403]
MLGTILHSHYQIVKVLGIGKSGTTYLAKDLDLIDSPFYIVKKIQTINIDPTDISLADKIFEIKGSIAYEVGKHPQIPTLFSKFTADDARYLVREYIDGEPLSQELTLGVIWSQTQVFDLLIELLGILNFVHGFGYIHQDINPHNIIRRYEDGRLFLIGFGCVQDLGNLGQNLPGEEPKNINDPSYVPYEQEQNVSKINSDIYAIGAIAIQALTGRYPIEKDAYSYELKWRDEVTIDPRLVTIINKMVRPDYRNRYQSASEVLEALTSYASTQIPTSKHQQFKPYLFLGTAVGALLLGFGTLKLFSSTSADKPQVAAATASTTSKVAATTMPVASLQSYVDKSAKIKVKYPATWQKKDIQNVVTGENVLFTSPVASAGNKYQANISVRIETLTNPQTSLANYTKSTIAEIDRYYQDAKIIESSPMTLAKKPGNLIVYTGKDENSLAIKNLEVWTIDRGKAYILTYKAQPDRYYQYLEAAMATINSFEIRSKE